MCACVHVCYMCANGVDLEKKGAKKNKYQTHTVPAMIACGSFSVTQSVMLLFSNTSANLYCPGKRGKRKIK